MAIVSLIQSEHTQDVRSRIAQHVQWKSRWNRGPQFLRIALCAGVIGGLAGCGSTEPPTPSEQHTSKAQPLTVSSGIPLSPPPASGASQSRPAIAKGNGIYLVVWSDTGSDSAGDVLGVRVQASDGAVLDAQPLRIAAVPAAMEAYPAVAFDGQNFLVVFEASDYGPAHIYGTRVRASDGAVLDSPAQYIGKTDMGPYLADQLSPSVAFDGVNYLVVWTGVFQENGTARYGVHGIRVKPSTGQTLESGSNVLYRGGASYPRVAYGNGRYLVTWTDSQISGVRLQGATGALIDTAGPIHISGSTTGSTYASVASSGDQFLVIWNGASGQLLGNRVNGSDGAVLDGTGFTVEQNNLGVPTVTFDGQDYRVAWQGSVSGAQTVLSTRISTAGVVSPEIALAGVSLNLSPSYSFPISAMGPGRFLVAYNSYNSTAHTYGRVYMGLVQDDNACEPGAPTLAVHGDSPLILECQPGVAYSDPGANAFDGCGNPVQVHAYNTGADSSGPGPNLSYEGSYYVSYAAWNAGGAANATRTVIVKDQTKPTLTLKGPSSMVHTCNSPWVDPGVTAVDTCYGDLTGSVWHTGEVNGWAEGVYTVRYDVTDSAGNSADSVTRTVEVVDCPW